MKESLSALLDGECQPAELDRLLSEMVQTGSPSDSVEFVVVDAEDRVVPSERDRRRTERVSFKPLSIRLDGAREGILVDLSEGGALLETSLAPPQDRPIAVEIEWKNTSVPLQARVARSVPRKVQLESATLVRTEYCVALEFLNMTPEQSTAVRLIIQGN